MPWNRKLEGAHALSSAERQARHRARLLEKSSPAAARTRRPVDRRSRPHRWRDVVSELLALQTDPANWAAALPNSLRDGAAAQSLKAIASLDLNDLADIELPRGYGRNLENTGWSISARLTENRLTPNLYTRSGRGPSRPWVLFIFRGCIYQQAAQDDLASGVELAAGLIRPGFEGLRARLRLARLEPGFFDLIRRGKRHTLRLSQSLEKWFASKRRWKQIPQ